MVIEWHVKKFDALSLYELYNIWQLREAVFVVEQKAIYLDADGKDLTALHVCAVKAKQLMGYARILAPDENNSVHFGRVCTNSHYRNCDLARQLVGFVLKQIKSLYGENVNVIISAQQYLVKFYQHFGFVAVSDTYISADGIAHVDMTLILSER